MTHNDYVNSPAHYQKNSKGIEVIDIAEELNFCRGNAVKYILRAGHKDPSREVEDLEKAVWYIIREIQRLRKVQDDRVHGCKSVGNTDKGGIIWRSHSDPRN